MSEVTRPAVATIQGMSPMRWALRRSLLGLTIMLLGVAGAACLFYFTIDAEAETRAENPLARRPAVLLPRP